jgi:PhnB protein
MYINAYLSFNGNCEEAFEFYRSVFGGEFTTVMRFGDVASGDPDLQEQRKIMHMELPIGKGPALMGSDTPGSSASVRPGTNFHISLKVNSYEEADRVFTGLTTGGKAVVPMAQAFCGAYFGMVIDRYEVKWMISYDTAR